MLYLLVTLAAGAGAAAAAAALLWARRGRIRYPHPHSYILDPPDEILVLRNADESLLLHWKNPAAQVEVFASTDPTMPGRRLARAAETDHVHILGLDPNKRHYFEIIFDPGTPDEQRFRVAERVVPLPSAPNFRDIGGYATADGRRVRWGRVYRSGMLSQLSEADLIRLGAMGLRLVCDFRSLEEITESPDRLPGDPGPQYIHLPVFIEDQRAVNRDRLRALLFNQRLLRTMMPDFYTHTMIDRNGALFKQVFERLASADNLPAVIHCTAGKDRAGLTAALLLLALGVPEPVVIADYSFSNRYYDHFRAITSRAVAPLARLGITVDDLHPLLVADPATLRATLDHIRARYGSVADYLRDGAHIEDSTIAALRDMLLE